MNATINSNASGTWTAHEGETVEVVDRAPNGMSTGVLVAGSSKVRWLPTRWLDTERDEVRRRGLRRCRTVIAQSEGGTG